MERRVDERTAPRRPVQLACQAVRERGFTFLGDVALDMSGGGLLLRTSKRVLTGESVIVSFFEPTESRWYDSAATVARVLHRRRKGDRERCVGLRFDSLSVHERVCLAHALERCMWGTLDAETESVELPSDGDDSRQDTYGVFAATQ